MPIHITSSLLDAADPTRPRPRIHATATIHETGPSALGSWTDVRGRWDPTPKGLSVEEWIHRGTVGRDHYVRAVYRGRFVPTGGLGQRSALARWTMPPHTELLGGLDLGQLGARRRTSYQCSSPAPIRRSRDGSGACREQTFPEVR